MVINGQTLLEAAPIQGMLTGKQHQHGVTNGLGEAGYDIRIKQEIRFIPQKTGGVKIKTSDDSGNWYRHGRFVLASSMEKFQMPTDMIGIVHDKSTWARRGLSVFNTVIENGWMGYLTLELVYHGSEELIIPAGAGIAQVMFHRTAEPAVYSGKYQHQEDRPVAARESV